MTDILKAGSPFAWEFRPIYESYLRLTGVDLGNQFIRAAPMHSSRTGIQDLCSRDLVATVHMVSCLARSLTHEGRENKPTISSPTRRLSIGGRNFILKFGNWARSKLLSASIVHEAIFNVHMFQRQLASNSSTCTKNTVVIHKMQKARCSTSLTHSNHVRKRGFQVSKSCSRVLHRPRPATKSKFIERCIWCNQCILTFHWHTDMLCHSLWCGTRVFEPSLPLCCSVKIKLTRTNHVP